jgi:prepilin-type N-terminal cleavage/methylation domain-containing protein/prepilin-type processing-associated H-X9-DG protein
VNKKAFSIVELLVVVAIIAVLAGILFPAFAQMVAQHKRSSESNLKEIGHALELYSEDADNRIIISANGPLRDLVNVRDGSLTSYGEQRSDQWPLLLLPYLKNRNVYVDPERGDADHIWDSAPHATNDPGFDAKGATYGNQNRFPMYGFNYLFLSPYQIPVRSMTDGIPTNSATAISHMLSEAEDPSHTVYFTVTDKGYLPVSPTDVIGVLDSRHGFWAINAPGLWNHLIASTSPYMIFWTGTNCSGDWCGGDVDSSTAGVQSRQNYFYERQGKKGNSVLFLDGHVKFQKTTQLMAGTDYLTATPQDGRSTYFGGGSNITDKAKYVWNLGDSYFGA